MVANLRERPAGKSRSGRVPADVAAYHWLLMVFTGNSCAHVGDTEDGRHVANAG